MLNCVRQDFFLDEHPKSGSIGLPENDHPSILILDAAPLIALGVLRLFQIFRLLSVKKISPYPILSSLPLGLPAHRARSPMCHTRSPRLLRPVP